jgi:3-oxoacyl-[acyl-carrier protein] reductase
MESSAVPSPSCLSGQWAVVTGASKGIGLGVAQGLARAGANVVLVARNRADLDVAADELRRDGIEGTVLTHVADVSDPRAIDGLFAAIRSDLPQLDVFVANAGSGSLTPFLELSADDWDKIVALNLTGVFLCCQAAARLMVERPATNQSIIVVSSIRALSAMPGRLVYSVTKAGVNQLVRTAAIELAPHRIRVNALSPGITETPLTVEGNPELFQEMAAMVPLGRAGTPLDMAAAAVYLASPSAHFVTGINLVVDGGESLV